jgi:hypothetical protein
VKSNARARLLGVLLCILAAAGCASLTELSNLSSRIKNEGYIGISVKHNTTNGFDTLAVNAYKVDQQADDGEAIFRLIWDTYPAEVDRVVVTVNDKARSATKAELEKAYGTRKIQPAAGGSGAGAVVAWILVAVLFVGVLATGVIVRRHRRRRREQAMPPQQPGPYYYKP